MSRENKRNRDAKRFGKAERLADHFGVLPFAVMGGTRVHKEEEQFQDSMRMLTSMAIAAKTIEATNVLDYVVERESSAWTGAFDRDIKNATPPFELCWVEMAVPSGISPQIQRIGWAVERFDKGDEPQIAYDAIVAIKEPDIVKRINWTLACTMTIQMRVRPDGAESGVISPVINAVCFLDENGDAVCPPVFSLNQSWFDSGQDDWASYWAHVSIFACLLAFCFMNCKNVSVDRVDPCKETNKERRKAGMKPFLQYHVINIDPMKQVLRTEGGVETNGLKKALHICRGHFATYADSMLGRKLDKPVTVWRPSHIRGSAKQGVVVSDYVVKAGATVEAKP